MSRGEYTPTPWVVAPGFHRNRIADADGVAVGYVLGSKEEASDTAAFIVLACNNHDKLVEALKAVTNALIERTYDRRLADAIAANGWRWTDDAPKFVRPDVDAALTALASVLPPVETGGA